MSLFIIHLILYLCFVPVDQSYWQSAIAATPQSAHKGYLLGGIVWFTIPFALATSLGLASTALMLPITAEEAGNGLVPPAVATYLYGQSGALVISIMLFMAIVSTGSAEAIAVSSLCSYDIYREYFNPEATGEDILKVSQRVIVAFCLLMGCLSAVLLNMGLGLGWVYLFMGIMIGSAVIPLWNMMMWDKASADGAVYAAWISQTAAIIVWILVAAGENNGTVTVDTLGQNYPMLAGNLTAICLSGIIHYVHSVNHPQDYDWKSMKDIKLIEDDQSGLNQDLYDTEELEQAYRWIKKYGMGLTVVFVVLWPALSLPEGVFNKGYFSFWVFISVMWGFCAAAVIIVLPIYESWDDIMKVYVGFMEGVPAAKNDIEVKKEAAKSTAAANMHIELASSHSQDYEKHFSNIVPELVDKATAKRMSGHAFNESAFDAIAVNGKITRADFLANKHEVA